MYTNKGFTLIEILIVMSIVSVVFGAVFSLSTTSFSDPLQKEYESVLGILYEKREQSVLNPDQEFKIEAGDFPKNSEVGLQIKRNPVFHFGEYNSNGSIKLSYGNRTIEIKISQFGGID